MSSYTKGKWTLNDRTGEIISGSHKIGEVYGGTDEYLSNARLIINAPELFSLVNSLLNYVRKYQSSDMEPAYKYAVKALIERAESVIEHIEERENKS